MTPKTTELPEKVRQDIDNAHAEFYVVWNTFRDWLPPVAINHLEDGLKILAEVLKDSSKPNEKGRE